jgi:hypothetical protein
MLDTILSAAFDSAARMADMPPSAQAEFTVRRPGRRAAGFAGLFRRRKPEEPQTIPGTKPHIERLFRWMEGKQLTIEPTVVAFTLGLFTARFGTGDATLAKLCAEFAPSIDGVKYTGVLHGEPLDIGNGRTLTLPASAPLPRMTLIGPKVIEARWDPPAKAKQGRFTADLRSVTIFPDRAEIDVAWQLLGMDLAKNPVVWWGE